LEALKIQKMKKQGDVRRINNIMNAERQRQKESLERQEQEEKIRQEHERERIREE
jgi:hypothetical protein